MELMVTVADSDAPANDSSGMHIHITNITSATVRDKFGRIVGGTDANGNYFSGQVALGNLKDTLGRSPIVQTVNGNTVYYDVPNSQGGTSRFTVTLQTITVTTAFFSFGISECTNCAITVVQSIALPDGTSYSFDYDNGASTYGLVTGVHLPTGGVINYSYMTFADSYGNKNRWVI